MRNQALAIVLSTISLGACHSLDQGTANVMTEIRHLPAFSSIVLNGISKVRIHKGPQAIHVTIDNNLADYYETKVKDGTLFIGFKCGFSVMWAIRNLKTCEVDITVPELDGIELNGQGTIKVDPFAFKELKLSMNGAASIELHGSASSLVLKCTGAGKLNARNLLTKVGRFSLTGAARVEATVEDEIDASITGSGQLTYWGNPRVTQRITGAGSIHRADN